jgi:hypothetical protein
MSSSVSSASPGWLHGASILDNGNDILFSQARDCCASWSWLEQPVRCIAISSAQQSSPTQTRLNAETSCSLRCVGVKEVRALAIATLHRPDLRSELSLLSNRESEIHQTKVDIRMGHCMLPQVYCFS